MRLRFHHRLLLAAALMAVVPSVPAAAFAYPYPAKAQACAACHGPLGQGGGIFPRIASQPAAYLRNKLQFYRSGSRPNAMMQSVTKGLSDADITALAIYFSRLHPPYSSSAGALPAVQRLRGQRLVTTGDWQHGVPACARCHGPDLGGVAPQIPALAGQPPQYMAATLRLFQSMNMNAPHAFPVLIMSRISKGLSDTDIQAVTAYIAQLNPGEKPQAVRPAHDAAYQFTSQSPDSFTPPPESAVPEGPDGDMIWEGLQVFENTQVRAHQYVGNALSCSNCHLDNGRRADSAPMWAAYVTYPKYRSKNHQVNTLEERIQGCFRFSMNGKPPAADSPEMRALISYFYWLATGLPVGITPKGAGYPKLPAPHESPSIERGAAEYAANCAMCHSDNGEGRSVRGVQVFPPLWGPRSFNWGAGMERISTAAAFIKANMPYGAGGTLSDQQAWDIAAFLDSHPRPQDPRFTGSVETTRKLYHSRDSYYGRKVNGKLLGAPSNSRE